MVVEVALSQLLFAIDTTNSDLRQASCGSSIVVLVMVTVMSIMLRTYAYCFIFLFIFLLIVQLLSHLVALL